MPTPKLIVRARKTGNPVIEGSIATLVWEGTPAPAIIDDTHGWDDNPQKMKRIGTGLWSFSFDLPNDAYLEYAFLDTRSGERLADPLNPQRIFNGINAYNNFFYMPGGGSDPLTHKRSGIKRGLVTKHRLPTLDLAAGNDRLVYVYHPPVDGPVPLALVYDGRDYLSRGRLNIIADNLISQGRVRPFGMVLVQNGGQARGLEYSCSESTLGFLAEIILPFARKQLNLLPYEKEPYCVIGASLGGLMSLFTGMRMSRIFGRVLSQSGAFGTPEYDFALVDLIRYAPKPDIRIWMDAGRLEWLLESNRRMYALLKEKAYQVDYTEFSAGHNYTAWRNDIGKGLLALFGK